MSLSSLERSNALAGMMRTLEEGGFARLEPPILQPAEVFLDLSGEELRRRLFQVQDPAGRELCLRPDMTIPVSRAHLAGGDPLRAADYCYLGPVFRHRPGSAEADEFIQAGMESFGDPDFAAADARIVALGLAAARGLGAQGLSLHIGDPTILLGFAAALELPPPGSAGCGRPSAPPAAFRRCCRTPARTAPALPPMPPRSASSTPRPRACW